MNLRPSNFIEGAPRTALAAAAGSSAMVTPSFSLDFERCRLLCETADAYVTGMSHHYILVESRDVKQFRQLESPRRTIVDERDLLPSWIRVFNDVFSGKRIWLSFRTPPLRGWHVQQLRRIAIASKIEDETLVYCDSDVVFLKPFDLSRFRENGLSRLFRRDGILRSGDHLKQRQWSRNAGRALGLADSVSSPHDYISTLIGWDRRTVVSMCDHMAQTHGRHWVEVITASRRFSECMVYGRFVDDVLGGAGHWHTGDEFCRVYWTGQPMSDEAFASFVAGMKPDQVAIGIQSFIGTDIERIRRLAFAP